MDFNKVDYKELLEDSFQLYNNPDNKSTTLQDIGVQFDCNDTTKNSPKDIKNRFVEPSVVPQVFVNEYEENIDNTWDSLENAKFAHINSIITRDNFYDYTACDWKEVKSHPEGKPDYESDSGSKYWYTDSGVYRESDHWGFGVGSCDWTLNENPELSWRDNEKVRVGYADFKDFKNTEGKSFPQIFEMLTPKEAGLEDTDQNGDIYYFNYRTNDLENKNNFVDDKLYPASIETRLYTECASEGADTPQPSSVTNKVNENVVDNVSNSVVNQVGGQSGTPRNYGSKKPGATSLKNYAFELTTIEKIAEEIVVEADLESKKPYLLQQLNKADITGDEAEKIITQINDADPTGNYATYTQWLLGQYLKGNFKLEDKDEAKELLKTFNEETKSKRLKGVNINQSKYQDLKAILEDHLGTSDKASDKLSKELEDTDAKFLTSYTDDETGDKYDLIEVTTPEDAEKLFSGSEWCVRHPETAEQYLENGNFLLLRKNGKNYLLKHPQDFKYVNDEDPTEEQEEEFNSVISSENYIKKYLKDNNSKSSLLSAINDGHLPLTEKVLSIISEDPGNALTLLVNKYVTKDNFPELYNSIVEQQVINGQGPSLIENGYLTSDNYPNLFKQAIDDLLENKISESGWFNCAVRILKNKIITKETNPEEFDKLVTKIISLSNKRYIAQFLLDIDYISKGSDDTNKINWLLDQDLSIVGLIESEIINSSNIRNCYDKIKSHNSEHDFENLIYYKVITKDDTDLFNDASSFIMDNSEPSMFWLRQGILTPDNPDYDKYIELMLINQTDAFMLLIEKYITKDNVNFEKALQLVKEDSHLIERLKEENILSQEDINSLNDNQDGESKEQIQESTPMDESAKDDTTKESAFEFTNINKLADLYGDSDRGDDIPESQNKFLNSLPVSEVDKDQKQKLMDEAKKVNKVINYIPKSLNYPFIEDEMAGNVLFFSETDFMEDLFNN